MMLEQRKERQCQIRVTERQYKYLQVAKGEQKCSSSAYFRNLLEMDIKASRIENKAEVPDNG